METPLKSQVIRLAELLAEKTPLTLSAMSNRISGGGTFFRRLKTDPSAGFTDKTYARCLNWFSENWPEKIEWPADIPRPEPKQDDAA